MASIVLGQSSGPNMLTYQYFLLYNILGDTAGLAGQQRSLKVRMQDIVRSDTIVTRGTRGSHEESLAGPEGHQ